MSMGFVDRIGRIWGYEGGDDWWCLCLLKRVDLGRLASTRYLENCDWRMSICRQQLFIDKCFKRCKNE